MRFRITCEVKRGESFPQEYKNIILRLIKLGLRAYPEIFEDFFGRNKLKRYCWSVYFPNSEFKEDKIILKEENKKFYINFSVLDSSDAMNIFNAFMNIRFKDIDVSEELIIRVVGIANLQSKEIAGNFLKAKIMSPIICRDHNQETQKDDYYIGTDEKFINILKRNLFLEMKSRYGDYVEKDIDELEMNIEKTKKIVSKFYGKMIDGTIGNIELKGKNYLINYIYSAGLGSIRGSGFGLLEKI